MNGTNDGYERLLAVPLALITKYAIMYVHSNFLPFIRRPIILHEDMYNVLIKCYLISLLMNSNAKGLKVTYLRRLYYPVMSSCHLHSSNFPPAALDSRAVKLVTYVGIPRVGAGKNTSTVIPASRKRRRKGNRISLR
jgi:hypothetical protein